MGALQRVAEDVTQSDWGQAFGLRKMPENKNIFSVSKNVGEFAFRLMQSVPGLGTILGLAGLAVLANRVKDQTSISEEDCAEFIRHIMAIFCGTFVLLALDVGTTYLRYHQEKGPHEIFNYA